MANLNTIHYVVKRILEEEPYTRNNDEKLYFRVVEHFNKDALNHSVAYFFCNRNVTGVPPFSSVERARRKVQELYPNLCACGKVKEARKDNELVFREYAKMTGDNNG